MAEFMPQENNTWKDSGTYDTSELLINNVDLRNLLDHEIVSIHTKIKNFGENLGIKNHNIDCTLYDNVYIFSDIHADFRKFCQILFEYDLIKINDANKNDMIDALYMYLDKPPDEEDTKNMYDIFFHIIENFEWNGGDKTLIVLIGDLVDGKRHPAEVYDPIGIFELLIHSLIHNIRIKSRKVNSDMLFTFGNHDFFGCFYTTYVSILLNYLEYIHMSCMAYYKNDLKQRLLFLRPFYINSPYLFLNLKYNGETKIKCIHAGIHKLNGERISDNDLDESQQMLNSITFDNIEEIPLKDIIKPIADTILVVRPYYNSNENNLDGCKFITDKDPLLIIGHCPTAELLKTTEIKNMDSKEYSNCDYYEPDRNKENEFIDFRLNPKTKGCVVVGCNHENHTPKLIYVDSALSNSFRNHHIYKNLFDSTNVAEKNRITNNINKTRHVEILKLRLDGTPDAKYYYNILERLNSGEDANNITIYQTPSNNLSELAVVGKDDNDDNNGNKGGKKTNKKYKKSYKKYKKQTRKRTTRKRRTKK